VEITFFASPAEFGAWLEEHGSTAQELWVGYHKKDSGRPGITWPESVDVALCYGWIDGLRKSIDEISYKIRFSPRKPGSTWSTVNIERVQALAEQGLMRPAGLKAFEARRTEKSGIYSYEQGGDQLAAPYLGQLQQNEAAWAFFQAQPGSYRKAAAWWVASAKSEATRQRRLAQLTEDSAAGRTVSQFTRRKSSS
jgi:uncharacterized protein YdeI (YjbR/CyaY-like superfamily)